MEQKVKINKQFHKLNNAEILQKSLVLSILTEVIRQGIEENIYMTSYRNETVAFLLASVEVIFDGGLFQWKPQEALQKVEVFITIIETALGTKKGYRRCFLHSY